MISLLGVRIAPRIAASIQKSIILRRPDVLPSLSRLVLSSQSRFFRTTPTRLLPASASTDTAVEKKKGLSSKKTTGKPTKRPIKKPTKPRIGAKRNAAKKAAPGKKAASKKQAAPKKKKAALKKKVPKKLEVSTKRFGSDLRPLLPPSRAMTARSIYVKEQTFAGVNTQSGLISRFTEVSNAYTALSPVEKAPYEAQSKAAFQKYAKDYAEWWIKTPSGTRRRINRVLGFQGKHKLRRPRSIKPKLIASGYLMYVTENISRSSLRDFKPKERITTLASEWRSLTDADKQVYNDKVIKLRADHAAEHA